MKAAAERRSEQHQLQSQIQTAPFVKPADRVAKDVSDMSMGDFAPKRFALKYDPIPTIVLEYLVPSTGKLYHHKMKLRQLTGESDVDEMLLYLEKRHPLYFLQRKLSKPQISNLIKKLVYRVGQMKPTKKAPAPVASSKPMAAAAASNNKPASDIFSQNKRANLRDLENKALEKENTFFDKKPTFKSGSQLPSLSDDLPELGGGFKKPAAKKFNDQFDDDFSAGSQEDEEEDEIDSPNVADNNEEDEDGNGDFDANELLNFQDYQKKRQGMGAGLGRDKESPLPSLAPVKKSSDFANKSMLGATAQAGADEAIEFSDEDEVDSEDSYEEEMKKQAEAQRQAAARIDFNRFDYKNTNLNALPDAELKAHKARMEVGFQANAVKKGDPGFMYDKRVDFKYSAEEAGENSWDESEDESDEGAEVIAASRPTGAVKSKPKGLGLQTQIDRDFEGVDNNDDDYFDDDFA